MNAKSRIALLTLAAFLAFASAWAGQAPAPPAQPKTGPGGAEVSHQQVVSTFNGSGARAYWLYEPAAPKPVQAPLIVFNHGWGAMSPQPYTAWIDHLVKRGNIVIYPVYQDSRRTPVADFTPNAVAAVLDAIRRLQQEPGHVRPQLDRFALAGHSMGGIVSANLAALWEQAGLPRPRAVMCVEPGKTWTLSRRIAAELADLSRIPADTLLLAVAGDRDRLARDVDAKRIFRESTRVPLDNKDFVMLVSDDHGQPALNASHFAPVAPAVGGAAAAGRVVDALDFFGTWKLLDALTDAAFYGKNREFALGNTPQQRFMGRWSDGVPVKELFVTGRP